MNTALKERRLSFSKTQAQLAEEAGISLRAYQNFEYGDRIPRTDVGNRLAQILHASPMELWGCGKEGYETGMPEYHVVSFSGGKDSTAMLLRMLELGMQVDEIIFCDTGVEFPQMYEHIDKVEKYIGRKITRLKAEHDYPYMLLEHEIKAHDGSSKKGYSFTDMWGRWCTSYFKRDLAKRYLRGKGNFVQYIGIAADEPKRIHDDVYPLVEWGWTEADCLSYCYDHGFDWGGLYDKFRRVSCWCCPLQNLNALRTLRKDFPNLWETLLDWQHKTWRKFRADYSVEELESRFAKEDEIERMQMKLF